MDKSGHCWVRGLGLHCVKLRAIAMLIHTFLSQAISPLFRTNYYLNTLYRWHVLGHKEIPDPGRPPYYSEEFFTIIKDIHENTPLNVTWVSLKQWYQILLERGLTHTSEDLDSPSQLIKSKLEESNPNSDFTHNYRMTRLFGLSPDQKSFLFKLVQNLIPTKERQHRCGKVATPSCSFCNDPEDNLEHIFSCHQRNELTNPLFNSISCQVDGLTTKDIIVMNIRPSESWELPAAWLVATCLEIVWMDRKAGNISRLETGRAELLARIALLRSTRWKNYSLHNSALLLEETINLHFC